MSRGTWMRSWWIGAGMVVSGMVGAVAGSWATRPVATRAAKASSRVKIEAAEKGAVLCSLLDESGKTFGILTFDDGGFSVQGRNGKEMVRIRTAKDGGPTLSEVNVGMRDSGRSRDFATEDGAGVELKGGGHEVRLSADRDDAAIAVGTGAEARVASFASGKVAHVRLIGSAGKHVALSMED